MKNKKQLFVISGAPGVGKSTIIKKICKDLPKAAHISVDKLRKFIRGGYVSPSNWSDKVEMQYRLARKNAADIGKNFLADGYVVFVDDVFRDRWKDEFSDWLPGEEIEFIYLDAGLDQILKRDKGRRHVVGKRVIVDFYNDLKQNNTEENGWLVLENNSSLQKIVEKLLSVLK